MNAQKFSQSVFIGTLITLFMAGCAAPQPIPQTKSTTDTATSETPTVTNTLILPAATATPAWNVVVGEKIILGPAEAIVTMLEEAQTSPVLDKPPQAGMKFILIGLNIVSQEPGETFASDRLFLETSSGKQYSVIRIYGPQPWSEGFNIIFEVATGENLNNLLLSYH